ncbi:hypothetical protein F5X97DRAFT_286299 [Nemania serpens]|nr:hypothetical protein F5X97DRAFT_286299 [Nemania serpens]
MNEWEWPEDIILNILSSVYSIPLFALILVLVSYLVFVFPSLLSLSLSFLYYALLARSLANSFIH